MRSIKLANARRWSLRTIVALLFVLVLAGCSTSATESEFTLTGVDWQWQSWSGADGINEVPTPADYTLMFNTDGTLNGVADCNNFGGTYTQENGGIQITMGPSTLVACDSESLGGTYTLLLDQVEAGGPDGTGNLALETAGGETRMIFSNPNAPAATGSIAGLPWWAWVLIAAILLGLLWWLMSRNRTNAMPTAQEMERAPKPVAPAAMAADTMPVVTPQPVVAPVAVAPDDLTRIEGIGPKIAAILVASGITTYSTLAGATPDELSSILVAANLRGSFGNPTTWPAQAKLAAAGDWDALKSLQATLKGGRAS